MFDVNAVRQDFPILEREINGNRLVYLDNGASAQKPRPVLDAMHRAYSEEYANVHRGLHTLSNLATSNYEAVRGKLQTFLNAARPDEIIYTTGTTHGINLVAYGWGIPNLEADDEIILTVMEHHANIVPWHFLRERQGCRLVWVECDPDGNLDPEHILDSITNRTRLIAITQTSNVLGTIVDIPAITAVAREQGIPVLADASQSAVHMPLDVQALGVDFLVLTGHKLYGPSASGALYLNASRMDQCRPFLGGGDMIAEVTRANVTYATPPHRYEAGTPPIVPMIGLGAALDYITGIGMEVIRNWERQLIQHADRTFGDLEWLFLSGRPGNKAAIYSFLIEGPAHAHDLSTILDQQGIAVRAGHHCAQPLMDFLGVTATCRASLALYNTFEEIDQLAEGLKTCRRLLQS